MSEACRLAGTPSAEDGTLAIARAAAPSPSLRGQPSSFPRQTAERRPRARRCPAGRRAVGARCLSRCRSTLRVWRVSRLMSGSSRGAARPTARRTRGGTSRTAKARIAWILSTTWLKRFEARRIGPMGVLENHQRRRLTREDSIGAISASKGFCRRCGGARSVAGYRPSLGSDSIPARRATSSRDVEGVASCPSSLSSLSWIVLASKARPRAPTRAMIG